MKRIFIAVFIIVLLGTLLMLSGCGSKSAPERTSAAGQQRVFTLEELKKYNGENGSPAYIAVKGIVYDVTKSPHFTNGVHNECDSTVAGADLTNLFRHGSGVLKKLPVVGTLQK